MIFVTVGNGNFEELVKELDKLKAEKKINEEVMIQLGTGEYLPQHCRWFRFESSLEKYYTPADLVISHGGPGTVFELLRLGKRFIALPNRDRTDPQHQVEYLQAMAKETTAFIYCENVEFLQDALEKAKTHLFTKYQSPECKIHLIIRDFLEK